MKIIVTHSSPDWDAITSVWLLKRFLPDWSEAVVEYVPAGSKLQGALLGNKNFRVPHSQTARHANSENFIPSSRQAVIENIDDDEVIHVDTGLGPLDHHQIESDKVCAASLTFDFVKRTINNQQSIINQEKIEAIERMVRVIVDIDHFKEVFWENPTADYHEFSFLGILEGLKVQKPNEDFAYIEFGMQILDALLHKFESRVWAEKELKRRGIEFETRFGKGLGIEVINDSVLDLAQKMGYKVVVRKDPRKGYVRIKARPLFKTQNEDIDLTLVYEKLKKMDPQATWFLHVSKKMLLNGSVKNPKMRPSTLTLNEIIEVLKRI